MRYELENDSLIVQIDSLGAELKSVRAKETDREYMWQGDPAYWGRTSPILFPIVGGLRDKSYVWQGKSYPMGQHGFARDMEFELLEKTKTSIRFRLRDNEETLAKYPMPFVLEIGCELRERTLKVLWQVTNPAEQTLWFSIGAHPAFNCPIGGEETKAGYRLLFPGKSEITYYGNETPGGLADEQDLHTMTLEQESVEITEDFFDRCTYITEGHQLTKCGIADPAGKPYVMLSFDMPLCAIWSPEKKQAPFLCIEPWCGRCDSYDYAGTLEERRHGNRLEPGEVFETFYEIEYL